MAWFTSPRRVWPGALRLCVAALSARACAARRPRGRSFEIRSFRARLPRSWPGASSGGAERSPTGTAPNAAAGHRRLSRHARRNRAASCVPSCSDAFASFDHERRRVDDRRVGDRLGDAIVTDISAAGLRLFERHNARAGRERHVKRALAVPVALALALAMPGAAGAQSISLDVRDAAMGDVVALLAAQTGRNIVCEGRPRRRDAAFKQQCRLRMRSTWLPSGGLQSASRATFSCWHRPPIRKAVRRRPTPALSPADDGGRRSSK